MAYDARAIANYFLDCAWKAGSEMTPMKLQKLIFFAHGWHLASVDAPLVVDPIEAWTYGPVIPSVYHAFKGFGSGAITAHATYFDFKEFDFKTPQIKVEDTSAREVLDAVWGVFKDTSAIELSKLSHVSDGPWAAAREGSNEKKGTIIRDDLIKEYFVKKAQNNPTPKAA
jgi:uncharacterized phage-associated protein